MRRVGGALVLAACLGAALVGRGVLAQAPADSTPADPTPAARRAAPLPPDRWLGADKVKHFFKAGFTAATGFSAARLAGLDRRPALGAGVGLAALVSVGKEVRDRHVTGRFSVRDLAADAIGVWAYSALLVRTMR
jgi:uncharacterized protein YfiM (DUF2279 family)